MRLFFVGLLFFLELVATAQTTFLPKDHLFQPILLDPLEAKTSGAVVRRVENGISKDGLFAPFSVGFQKGFVRWTKSATQASELALDIVVNTQFEMFHDSQDNQFHRYLYNIDYKVGLLYALKRGNSSWRFRLYHISSHLGDDYLIHNNLFYFTPNAVNYEQIDVLYSRQMQTVRLYGGVGSGLRSQSERKRLYAQAGFVWKQPNREKVRLWAGTDVRLVQQTGFHPGVSAAIGFEFGPAGGNPISIALQVYHGPLPYSSYENRINNWAGIGFLFNPF
ncbi:MAG: DUF1207 domain-containing protein [Siphonobacter sp.]